ncbi:uncharacterized protein LOC131335690 [Rhododendron vialii]|uniref:uncharacterized protein LOC131335690 n=1 Tax=Rhododendron vialii TaxID=182163 RepID=UPI00265F09EE|nr:uncharacterized protein LOC131335690 [Rhododendron vialii]
MEELSTETNRKKRIRANSDFNSAEEKRVDSESPKSSPKRARKDSYLNSSEFVRVEWDEFGVNSPESNRIPDDILDILDDPDPVADSAIQDLDSVIKSFEEEILPHLPSPVDFPITVPEYVESQGDLGYLLEASDDELGLPPTAEKQITKTKSDDLTHLAPEALGSSEVFGFEGELSSYEPFGFEASEENDDFVAVGGLFRL